jgi:uncharacterized protein
MADKGDITVKDAGRKGGQATSKTHDHSFYRDIGHKGGLKGGRRVRDLIERGKEAAEKK